MGSMPKKWPAVLGLLILTSCAARHAGRADALLSGNWSAGNGVIVRIGRLPDNRLGAEIVSARGFYSNDLGAGTVVIRDIRPRGAGFTGKFVMPGTAAPVTVRMRLLNRDTLLFGSADRRVKGNRMVWKRILPEGASPLR